MDDHSTNKDQMPPVAAPAATQHHAFMGILAYLGILVLVPLLLSKDDPFIKFHAKQGLTLFIAEAVAWFVFAHFLGALWIVWQFINLAIFILVIMGIMNVVKGRQDELPLIGSLAHSLPF